MNVVADENGWELMETDSKGVAVDLTSSTQPSSIQPASNNPASTVPGSGVFRKVDGVAAEVEDAATMPTDPAPASGDEEEVRLPSPGRLPSDLAGDKTRVA
jgi:hypothetical protein